MKNLKNKGKKEIIDSKPIFCTLTTPKNSYNNGWDMNVDKIELYKRLPLSKIENALEDFSIHISQKEILQLYQQNYNMQSVIDYYHELYEKELNQLNAKEILLDIDCILFYVEKTIAANLDTTSLPDAYWIIKTLEDFLDVKNYQKPEVFLNICKSINLMSSFTKERNIFTIFDEYSYYFEEAFEETLGIDFVNIFPSLQQTKDITDEIFKMLENFEFEDPYQIYGDCLDLLARFGYDVVDKKYKQGLDQYPDHTVYLTNCVIICLPDKDKSICKELYTFLFNYTPTSKDDEMMMEDVRSNYEIDKEKF